MQLCPCKSGSNFNNCCEPLIEGKSFAETPEQLMRSRYTAFSLKKAHYLLTTSSKKLAADLTEEQLADSYQDCDFVDLEIRQSDDDTVEFVASFIEAGQLHKLHERSLFVKEAGQWKYDSGELFPATSTKLSRNEPCPCGSGKKAKRCHL